ncbi:MAG TPA: DUF4149 domain-containing protein [Candidatus Binataceae bacterium]|nr:DUF4149 domain-containing protein [Candidatus Binataceae bacterium]
MLALFVYLLCLACWLGGMVFFSAIVAPVIFAQLSMPDAGKVVSALFPRYYLLGYIAGGLGLVLAVYLCVMRVPRLWWAMAAVALAIALGLTFYAGQVVRPQVDAIRTVAEEANPDPARRAEFDRLHRLSVILNGAMMVLNLAALFSSAVALTPRP